MVEGPAADSLPAGTALPAETGPVKTGTVDLQTLSPEARAERYMRAFAAGYPEAIERVEYRNGDWAVYMKGIWFYWADGKLLSEDLLDRKDEFARQSFYFYMPDLPPWKVPEGEQAERLRTALSSRRANPPKRSPLFFDTLWDARTRNESYDNVKRITLFGKGVLVHKSLMERFARVDELVREAAGTDPAVQAFLDNIGSLGAWNWRDVAATASRSYHSYAVALDILPKNLRGQQTYWQWTADVNEEWYKVPYSGRYHPPELVVKFFERYGFCWGGKWPLFDTMHFEYRPEILLYHGMPVEGIDHRAFVLD